LIPHPDAIPGPIQGPIQLHHSPEPDEDTVKQLVGCLLDIFPHLQEDVIKVALKHASWNTDHAAENLLADESNIKNYTKEAEERKKLAIVNTNNNNGPEYGNGKENETTADP